MTMLRHDKGTYCCLWGINGKQLNHSLCKISNTTYNTLSEARVEGLSFRITTHFRTVYWEHVQLTSRLDG